MTVRPRLAAWVCGSLAAVCTAACAALLLGLDTNTAGDVVGFVTLDALIVWFLWRQASVYVKVTDNGLKVRNLFSTTSVTWAEIYRVRYGVDTAWAKLELTNGEDLPLMAIQSADGKHAASAARELQSQLAEFDAGTWEKAEKPSDSA